MKAWRAAMTVAAALAVGTAWAATDDNAKSRSGGGSSSVGARHHSDSGDSKSSGSSSGSSSSSSSSSSSNSGFRSDDRSNSGRTPTAAQLRHPRAGTGTGFRDRFGRSYRYYGYDPFWYGYGFYGYNWYAPFYYGGYYGGYGGYQPYPHRYGYSYREGSVRVLVQPNDTRVYVDGYYAGIADDFDGLFQRLRLEPGRHDVSLRLDGYRTHNVKLYVPYDGTIKLHHRMVRGTGEENAGVVGRPEDYARLQGREDRDDGYEQDESYGDVRDRRDDQRGDRALVRLDVRPVDASVYVDGAFRGTGRELRQLRLTAGRHRIEVVRPGYRTVEREVDVTQGQTLDLDIDLDRS